MKKEYKCLQCDCTKEITITTYGSYYRKPDEIKPCYLCKGSGKLTHKQIIRIILTNLNYSGLTPLEQCELIENNRLTQL